MEPIDEHGFLTVESFELGDPKKRLVLLDEDPGRVREPDDPGDGIDATSGGLPARR